MMGLWCCLGTTEISQRVVLGAMSLPSSALHSSSPDEGESWSEPKTHLANVEIHPDDGDQIVNCP